MLSKTGFRKWLDEVAALPSHPSTTSVDAPKSAEQDVGLPNPAPNSNGDNNFVLKGHPSSPRAERFIYDIEEHNVRLLEQEQVLYPSDGSLIHVNAIHHPGFKGACLCRVLYF